MGFRYDINRYPPKLMVTIPLIVLLLALASLGVNTLLTGMPVTPGMDFAGGTAVTVFTTDTSDQITAAFADYPLIDVESGINNGKYLKFGPMEDAQFRSLSALILQKYPDAKIDQIGASFGATLQEQAIIAMAFSFILMAIVVFVVFRIFVPSAAVVLSAFSDIVIAAALMNVFGIPLSLATTAALLMLIGFSVDSDILLTNRVLKRQGNLADKMAGAFTTGFIMTSTAIAAVIAMWVVSLVGQVEIIFQISTVMLFGLVADIFNTWVLNAGILRWYLEGREAR
ncbi:MAG: protein translocase subunit SecF [Methanospirillum sp.]